MLKILRYIVGYVWILSIWVIPSAYGYSISDCKVKNFWDFFNAFSESIEMQRACTLFPLDKIELVFVQDELSPKMHVLKIEQVSFPLIINKETRLKQHISLETKTKNNKKAKVVLYKQDTGYQIIYRFVKKKASWQLIKIEDWSV